MGGNVGSTSVGVSPGRDSGDRASGPPDMSACITWCCCSSVQTDGSGMAFGSNPAVANGLGEPAETERAGRGDGDKRIGGVGIKLSSPTKVLIFVESLGNGGSVCYN